MKGTTWSDNTAFGDGVYGLAMASGNSGVLGFANGFGAGVYAYSAEGPSLYADMGSSGGSWAGHFDGRVKLTSAPHLDIEEFNAGVDTSPPNPAGQTIRLFAKDNGSGKAQLCVRFPSGAAIVLATEA